MVRGLTRAWLGGCLRFRARCPGTGLLFVRIRHPRHTASCSLTPLCTLRCSGKETPVPRVVGHDARLGLHARLAVSESATTRSEIVRHQQRRHEPP